MAKPYSQDLRDRVIDAVERGEMSRRAAGRHSAAISESATSFALSMCCDTGPIHFEIEKTFALR